MTDRERFLACLLGQHPDRPPYWLMWGPWGDTWRRWRAEGMPAEFTEFRHVQRFFGAEASPAVLPVNVGPCPAFKQDRLEETADWYIFVDSWGIRRRNLKDHEAMSEFIAFPVKSRADWERYKRERLDPAHPARLEGKWRQLGAEWTARGLPIQLGGYPDATVFGGVRWLLGDEDGLAAFHEDPGLVHEIMEHLTTIQLTVYAQVVQEVRVDVIHIWEDMCGRQGSLISPRHWEEFMGPCYRRLKAFALAHGIPLLSVDTDGWPDQILPPMMRAGVNYVFPFEVAAGCDVNDYQRRYPELGTMGGIDKRVLAQTPAAIDRELERIRPAIERGRYIPELDHLIPSDVPWENYCHYARGLKQLVGKNGSIQ